MGESLVETSKVDNKMSETFTNLACLQQSVSFGRFEHDSLCWERWSTFPTNKYLEEVEKCSTPGSVAQKKAYFEAHYKKIAARRAELLMDQERGREAEMRNHEDLAPTSLVCDASEDELVDEKPDMENSVNITDGLENEVGSFDGEAIVEHVSVKNDSAGVFKQENNVGSIDDEVSVEHVHVKSDTADVVSQENNLLDLPGHVREHIDGTLTVNDVNELGNLTSEECEDVGELNDDDNIIHEVGEAVRIEVIKDIGELNDGSDVDEVVKKEIIELTDEPDDGSDLINESNKRPQEESCSEESCPRLKIPESGQTKEPVSEIENMSSIVKELPREMVKRTIAVEVSKNLIKLASPKQLQKATVVKKTTSATNAKNVPASPICRRTSGPMPKSSMLATPKLSKPESTKSTKSANCLLDKKENGFTPLTSKKTIGPQNKRVYPTSLHMSLSLGPMNSGQASLPRKSLIMESMGDKDIVKRAFKAFQTTSRMSPSSLAKSSATNQSASRKAEPKGSPANSRLKKNEGIGTAAKTASTRTGQQGTRTTALSPGVKKNLVAEQRNVKSVAASFGPRVQLQGNSQIEASKKLESKSKFDATHPHSKLKVENAVRILGLNASQVRTPSQNINSKSKLQSSNIRGYGGSVHKGNGTSKIQAMQGNGTSKIHAFG